jgi:protein gp37
MIGFMPAESAGFDMAENTKIEWATHTFNPFIGCTKVSAGCDYCYAESMMDHRYHRVQWGPHGERVRTSAEYWKQPLRWAKKARDAQEAFEERPIGGLHGERPERPRIFCASLADVFDNQVPPEWRADLFRLIAATPELDWLLLTKRPENIEKMFVSAIKEIGLSRNPPNINPSDMQMPWPNVWLGFTAEDQENYERRWRIMREIPAAVRFCSYEPAIGPLRIFGAGGETGYPSGLGWLICGGESGKGYRWMEQEWEENVRRDCARAGIPYFFKQRSGKLPIPADFPVVRQFPNQGESA